MNLGLHFKTALLRFILVVGIATFFFRCCFARRPELRNLMNTFFIDVDNDSSGASSLDVVCPDSVPAETD